MSMYELKMGFEEYEDLYATGELSITYSHQTAEAKRV
jgi:hypothetical protein